MKGRRQHHSGPYYATLASSNLIKWSSSSSLSRHPILAISQSSNEKRRRSRGAHIPLIGLYSTLPSTSRSEAFFPIASSRRSSSNHIPSRTCSPYTSKTIRSDPDPNSYSRMPHAIDILVSNSASHPLLSPSATARRTSDTSKLSTTLSHSPRSRSRSRSRIRCPPQGHPSIACLLEQPRRAIRRRSSREYYAAKMGVRGSEESDQMRYQGPMRGEGTSISMHRLSSRSGL